VPEGNAGGPLRLRHDPVQHIVIEAGDRCVTVEIKVFSDVFGSMRIVVPSPSL